MLIISRIWGHWTSGAAEGGPPPGRLVHPWLLVDNVTNT